MDARLNTDFEEKRRAELEREAIGTILQGVSETSNLDELLDLIHCAIGRVIYAENCFVALYDKAAHLFRMQFFVDKYDEVPAAARLDGTRTQYVFTTRKPLFLDPATTSVLESEGKFRLVGSPPKFWLGTPLKTPSEVIGVLVVQSYDDDHIYSDRDLEFLSSVAGTVAFAIERKRAETRMLLQTVALEAAANGVVITDKKGVIEWVNPAFSRLTGYALDEAVGKNPSFLKSGQTTANVYASLWKTITKGEVWRGELVNRRKNGSLYDEEMTVTPVNSSDGVIEHFIAIKLDITERKVAEEQLKVFNDKLQQSNRELQDFAYVASHDLQEPLRKVQTFADRLSTKYSDRLDETGLDYLERMRNAAGRMQTLINDLLSFSRVATKAKPFVPVDLEQITREVLSDLEVKIEETGAVIEIDDLPRVDGDPLQIRQLIQNLVGNALKFRRKDVALLVKIRGEKAATVNGNENGGFKVIVEDNGIGFDEKYSDKIFTVFQRLHGRTEYEGSGIGLAVCRKIVERHHGTSTAKSKPDHGSQFVFTLPNHQQNAEVD